LLAYSSASDGEHDGSDKSSGHDDGRSVDVGEDLVAERPQELGLLRPLVERRIVAVRRLGRSSVALRVEPLLERVGLLEAHVDPPELELDDPRVEEQAGQRFLLLGVAEQLVDVGFRFDDLEMETWRTGQGRVKRRGPTGKHQHDIAEESRRVPRNLETDLVVLHRHRCDPHVVGSAVLQRLDDVLEDAQLRRKEFAGPRAASPATEQGFSLISRVAAG
jgi:hypothetical protein